MRETIAHPAILALGTFGAALLLAGCANFERGHPHPSERPTSATSLDDNCRLAHPQGSPQWYSEAKRKAIERYEAAQKKKH